MSSKALKTAIKAIQKFYPLDLADRSWDNVGLLVDASVAAVSPSSATASASRPFKILLTVDLTRSVCREAISKNIDLVLAYHPFIFRGLKSVGTTSDPQQVSLVQLIKHGVSVYSPHTAVDAARGGVNDWLVAGISGGNSGAVESSTVIEGARKEDIEGTGPGMGRFATLSRPLALSEAIANVKKSLGIPHVQVAVGEPFEGGEEGKSEVDGVKEIRTVAVCAGSGGSVFGKYLKGGAMPDLIYTGEMSHHEVLAFKERGASVIVCNHSNTERGYLRQVQENLMGELGGDEFSVEISETDADPLRVY